MAYPVSTYPKRGRVFGLAAAVFCLLVCSCDFPQGHEDKNTTLTIGLPGTPGRGAGSGENGVHLPGEITNNMEYEIYLFGPGGGLPITITTREKAVTVDLEPGLWDISVAALHPASSSSAAQAFAEGVDIRPGQANFVSLTMNADEGLAPGGASGTKDVYVATGTSITLAVMGSSSPPFIAADFASYFPSDWTNDFQYQWFYEDENGATHDVTGSDNLSFPQTLSYSPVTTTAGYFTYYVEFTNTYTWKGDPVTKPAKRRVDVAVVELASSTSHNIGDTGPGGGTVFYKGPRFYVNGQECHYLEVGPDLGLAQWGLSGTYAGGDPYDYNIGAGYANTQTILAALNGTTETGRAAQLAAAHNGGGQTDWFLPSFAELQILYDEPTVPFGSNDLWSSTERTEQKAMVHFENGSYNNGELKTTSYRVRPVRAF